MASSRPALDVLIELPGRGLIEQAALSGELEQVLGCSVHVITSSALGR